MNKINSDDSMRNDLEVLPNGDGNSPEIDTGSYTSNATDIIPAEVPARKNHSYKDQK